MKVSRAENSTGVLPSKYGAGAGNGMTNDELPVISEERRSFNGGVTTGLIERARYEDLECHRSKNPPMITKRL